MEEKDNKDKPVSAENNDENSAEENPQPITDTKKLLYLIGIVVAVFALILGIVQFTGNASEDIVTIDDLHKKNLIGESGENNYLYNGFSFVYADGLWYTRVKPGNKLVDVPLHFGPKELENIEIKGSLDDTFNENKEVYITFDPLNEQMQYTALASAELSLNLAKGILKTPVAACIKNETSACEERPIMTCSSEKPVIYIKESKTPMILLNDNCIIVQGKDWDVVKATDRLILYWYGVF